MSPEQNIFLFVINSTAPQTVYDSDIRYIPKIEITFLTKQTVKILMRRVILSRLSMFAKYVRVYPLSEVTWLYPTDYSNLVPQHIWRHMECAGLKILHVGLTAPYFFFHLVWYIYQKLLLAWKFSCINKNCFFVKEMDTFGHIVVWTTYTPHKDHFTPQHTAFGQSTACLSVF